MKMTWRDLFEFLGFETNIEPGSSLDNFLNLIDEFININVSPQGELSFENIAGAISGGLLDIIEKVRIYVDERAEEDDSGFYKFLSDVFDFLDIFEGLEGPFLEELLQELAQKINNHPKTQSFYSKLADYFRNHSGRIITHIRDVVRRAEVHIKNVKQNAKHYVTHTGRHLIAGLGTGAGGGFLLGGLGAGWKFAAPVLAKALPPVAIGAGGLIIADFFYRRHLDNFFNNLGQPSDYQNVPLELLGVPPEFLAEPGPRQAYATLMKGYFNWLTFEEFKRLEIEDPALLENHKIHFSNQAIAQISRLPDYSKEDLRYIIHGESRAEDISFEKTSPRSEPVNSILIYEMYERMLKGQISSFITNMDYFAPEILTGYRPLWHRADRIKHNNLPEDFQLSPERIQGLLGSQISPGIVIDHHILKLMGVIQTVYESVVSPTSPHTQNPYDIIANHSQTTNINMDVEIKNEFKGDLAGQSKSLEAIEKAESDVFGRLHRVLEYSY